MINIIDLKGEWRLALDKERKGNIPEFCDTITLPNSTSNAGKGEENTARETGFLTDTRLFEGDAWFAKTVDLSPAAGRTAKLFLERTRMTRLFIDDEEVGAQDSLTCPHVYDISQYATTGRHEIAVCVSNIGYPTKGGHLTSPDTQTNWNGITGEISVRIYGAAYADGIRVYPSVERREFRVCGRVEGSDSGVLTVSARSFNAPEGKDVHVVAPVEAEYKNGSFDMILPLGGDAREWDEYDPELYKITVTVGEDKTSVTAGLREFTADGDKFRINGRRTFLRGKHDGMIFPKTGFAPTDVDEWVRILKISRSYGMNHYRFHTCCPPEAAFEAADIVGIYMEPQLPFWGTIQAPGEEGYNEEEQSYLVAEGFRMLAAYGNHPSFCMMSMGNELWGSKERLNEIIGEYKKTDSRHLYTQGSNNFQWFPNVVENDDFFVGVRLSNDRLLRGSYAMCDAPLGHVQTNKPSAKHSYDGAIRPERSSSATEASGGTVQIQYGTTMKTVKATEADADFIPEIPIVTHEIGQYETYPNFDEIEKYTGSIKARNFEIFRERLDEKGLLPLAHDYFTASGELAVQCYKEEMESVFRSEYPAGFQVLDIQDFSGQGTALVGVLDAFMDEKGTCSPSRWREFCSDVVALAEFDDYCVEGGSDFSAELRVTNFRPNGIEGRKLICELTCECGETIYRTERTIPENAGNYIRLGGFTAHIPDLEKPAALTLSLCIEGTDVKNHYDLSAYPKRERVDLEGAYIFGAVDKEAEKLLSQGRTVLVIPDLDSLENSIEGFYCQDFWCFPMFRSISNMMNKPEPVGTMGLLINSDHPALADFPCKKFSEPKWWEIVTNSRSEILDREDSPVPADVDVIVRTIDNFERNHDLAMMYEYKYLDGKVLVCNCDLEKISRSPEGRQFIFSVLNYVKRSNGQ